MVVNEKALIRCMKEAYKHQGYTVAVYDGWMMINGGYWLVKIAEEETSNELRSLIALHMRDIPQSEEAFKTVKGDNGPIVQRVILETALKVLTTMEERLVETMGENGPTIIRRSAVRYDGAIVWQNAKDLAVLMVDPRYEALLESHEGCEACRYRPVCGRRSQYSVGAGSSGERPKRKDGPSGEIPVGPRMKKAAPPADQSKGTAFQSSRKGLCDHYSTQLLFQQVGKMI